MSATQVFDTDRRIRLGIWGLGRGMSFFKTCAALNIDVVAGCDLNADLRRGFLERNPGAFVTADEDAFLAQDMDAVLVATYATGHAAHAIKCLRAGKHVLSEVPAFFTPAEGVRLVEAVEETGLVYQLGENYPFSAVNRYLARKYREGLFGKIIYAEYSYLHETLRLTYTYLNGTPVEPGHTVHTWRSWLNSHYYCTHSLGPVMVITGARPVRVVALPGYNRIPGHITPPDLAKGPIGASLICMSDGAIVRNLMGHTTDDTNIHRLFGTKGSAGVDAEGLWLRLGGAGRSPKARVDPELDELDVLARDTGHKGGDFWVLYHFARELLYGVKGPFDVYRACDVTLPGIFAYRSARDNGMPYDIPDFRNKEERDKYRHDEWHQAPYDVHAAFPPGAGVAHLADFTAVMKDLIHGARLVRAFVDWMSVAEQVRDKGSLHKDVIAPLLGAIDGIPATYARARQIADAYPESDAARAIRELLELGEEALVMSGDLRRRVEAKAEEFEHLAALRAEEEP